MMQQQHQQMKQQQLNRQKFQQSHLLPVGSNEFVSTKISRRKWQSFFPQNEFQPS